MKHALGTILCLCVGLLTSPLLAKGQLWSELPADSSKNIQIQMPSLAPLVEEVEPAVLVVYTESKVKMSRMPPGMAPFPFRFFPPMPEGHRQKGQGSGFLIHPAGYALTNHHVVEGAERIKVRVGKDTREVEAEIVGSDPNTDVALIRLKGKRKDWPVIPLGDSDQMRIGDYVVAIGNPFGLELSVSMGILSARGRRDIAPSGRQGLYDFLQTDASINPGNSGGPLLNLSGQVIGINAAVNAAGQGIGFAIPSNLVKQILGDLKDKGRVVRSWLGVVIDRVTPELSKGLGLSRPFGALVRQVTPQGPAQEAGVEPGDIITHFDGETVEKASQLPLLAGLAGVHKRVKLTVWRDGRSKNLMVQLGERPEDSNALEGEEGGTTSKEKMGKLGLSVRTPNQELRREYGMKGKSHGALITQVGRHSPAAAAGLKPGDIVTKMNGRRVKDAQDFVEKVKAISSGDMLQLLVRRQSATVFIAIVKP